jgi:hypothetical protein
VKINDVGVTIRVPCGVIVNVNAFETVAPGFTTVMVAMPGIAIRLAGTAAVNCVALMNVVVNGVLFQVT